MKPMTKPTQRDEAFLQRGNGEPWAPPTIRAKHNKGMNNKTKWRWCMAQGSSSLLGFGDGSGSMVKKAKY